MEKLEITGDKIINRIIKFRVWDIELHMWINNIGMGKDNTLTKGTEKRFHVMQFTGMKDKNGHDIYEGDVRQSVRGIKYIITWEDGGFIGKGINSHFEMRMSKIITESRHIGNVYDNPKLFPQ